MAKKDEKIKEEAAEDAEEVVEEEAAEEVEEVLEETTPVEEAERPWTKKYNPDTGLYDTVYLD